MKTTTEKGKDGEEIAAKYLRSKGYVILKQNYRSGRNEIDLVAQIGNDLVIIEVKLRKNNHLAYPEDAVDEAKQLRLADAAEALIRELQWKFDIRYDIISITKKTNAVPEIVHFEDAFWPGEIF